MNRNLAIVLTTLMSALPAVAFAEELTPEEQAFFDQHAADLVRFETEKMDDLALDAVFSAPFYSVKVILSAEGSTTTLTVARVGDAIVSINRPGEDGDLPEFQKLLNPDFKLRTNTDAKMMQQALNVLYPAFMESDKKLLTFRRTGNSWIFVRGEFFDSKSGYIFETDAAGAIKSVKYLLKLP